MNQVKNILKVDSLMAGMRIDKFLKQHFLDLSFGAVQKILRTGQIRVNGKRIKPNFILEQGQEIRLPPTDQFLNPQKKEDKHLKPLPEKAIQDFKSWVLYEDDHLYIINKPKGLAVQGGSKVKISLDRYFDGLVNVYGEKPRILHRLDKDTSGCLMIARTKEAAQFYGQCLKDKRILKYYLALSQNIPEKKQGIIDAPLAKQDDGYFDKVCVDEIHGKQAITGYHLIAEKKNKALVLCMPLTGRTHQIRVHLSTLNCPILGDDKYGYRADQDMADLSLKSFMLHAYQLLIPKMESSDKDNNIKITAPFSDEMHKILKKIGFTLSESDIQLSLQALNNLMGKIDHEK